MNTKKFIKIASVVAISGFILVISMLVSKFLINLEQSTRNTIMVIGFTLMLLGTLWRVVLEMNE
ncbi:MAG: hypothetical protein COW03_13305 [Cytophagales bacterium CG12_big_fil_rev_8_21_14_0_65_40_12]|nr:MAG: hypothetical protein COW03_13305 [Cytophagales bacterium CG12_big_fil_rev_8_21_14_0_65_40_12]PIW03114.1 MAG: hypothetical protein COW40_17380 [Cytophagales bacterium CG17_big_fil_post_rev_8_21_14_2_50_40_13]